jgi:hypothetical protein
MVTPLLGLCHGLFALSSLPPIGQGCTITIRVIEKIEVG